MAKQFKIQVASDVTMFAVLLTKLGFTCGPIKAAAMNFCGRVDIWFVPGVGSSLKRATAMLVRGEKTTIGDSPRRVYKAITVKFSNGSKGHVEDRDFAACGLEDPQSYGFSPESSDCSNCA